MNMAAAARGFLSLLQPRYFVRDPQSSLRAVAGKFDRPEEVAYCAGRCGEGLGPAERRLLESNLASGARILDIGCGAGRCALALADRGHDVVGIDVAPAMVAAAREAAREKAGPISGKPVVVAIPYDDNGTAARGRVCFETCGATELDDRFGVFDAVLLSDGVYSLIPGSRLRIDALQRAARALAPGGLILLFPLYRRRALLSRIELYGAAFHAARTLFPGRDLPEPGDVMRPDVSPNGDPSQLCYVHLFAGVGEVEGEIRRAGLAGTLDAESGAWIVRPAARSLARDEDARRLATRVASQSGHHPAKKLE